MSWSDTERERALDYSTTTTDSKQREMEHSGGGSRHYYIRMKERKKDRKKERQKRQGKSEEKQKAVCVGGDSNPDASIHPFSLSLSLCLLYYYE